ncbi:MAG TPA: NUDIX hydrolase [Thermomicrobiales bacterium]|nr:NUDIX hydrolase [Thermomicrobiales bacterium]
MPGMENRFFVNVEVAIVRDGRYLMIVRGEEEEFGAGWLCMAGGTVEWQGPETVDDVLETTARREVMEEIGLDLAESIIYVESHTFVAGGPALDVVMLAQPASGEATPYIASPGEVASLQWMTVDDACADERAQPWTRESLRRAERVRTLLRW